VRIIHVDEIKTWYICEDFKEKFYYIIEAPQKHFNTMGKYISDDVFVSMTAFCSTRAERYRCQVYHFSWTSARPCVALLTSYKLSHMPVILFWSGSQRSFRTSLPLIKFVFCILHWSSTELTAQFLLKTLYKYVLYFISYFDRHLMQDFFFTCEQHVCQQIGEKKTHGKE